MKNRFVMMSRSSHMQESSFPRMEPSQLSNSSFQAKWVKKKKPWILHPTDLFKTKYAGRGWVVFIYYNHISLDLNAADTTHHGGCIWIK